MPIAPTYPGVYIEEVPSGVHTITGAATSVAAFVDFFPRGEMNKAVQVLSFADFEREYGGLHTQSEASYAIRQFFQNGGTQAWVVRVASGTPAKASVVLMTGSGGANALTLEARSEGEWGNALRATVDYDTGSGDTFNLNLAEVTRDARPVVLRQETFRGLSMQAGANSAQAVVNAGSKLARVTAVSGNSRPAASGTVSVALNQPFSLAASANARTMTVTVNPGPAQLPQLATIDLGKDAISLTEVAARLEAGIRGANREWDQVTVRVVTLPNLQAQLQVVAGLAQPEAVITFADAAGSTLAFALGLAAGAVANVAQYQFGATAAVEAQGVGVRGANGDPPEGPRLTGSGAVDPPTGMYALNKVEGFNLLCLPRISQVGAPSDGFPAVQVDPVITEASEYCRTKRAVLLLDTPYTVNTPTGVREWMSQRGTFSRTNVALYFPRVEIRDPLNQFRLRSFGASGTMAGVCARTDANRGVWKAPAGTEAALQGVERLAYRMTDPENGTLNPEGINALRFFETWGSVCWGARTLDGSDRRASEWKYLPIRRLALFLEQSLYDATQWVVFEPNDEPLWAQIRMNVGTFMHRLFRQGAFQGKTAREAYLVKCDGETTTQDDRNRGIVNIVVGFAPLKPAEFVIIRIQQIANQDQA